MRAAFYTLGCKVNQYETTVLMSLFASEGFDITDFSSDADVYVINSCTVTESGDKKLIKLAKKVKAKNPNAVLAVIGCFPQAFEQKAIESLNADILQGSINKKNLLSNVKKFLISKQPIVDIQKYQKGQPFEKMHTNDFYEHTRAFVKIEDGCDRYCTYCIIPKARGPIRSRELDDLKAELLDLAQKGYKEVVLVGINLSSYGKETGYEKRLIDAVETACSVDGIERVRLGSIEPELLTKDDLFRMSKQEKFCPQFHLALQSGCDETLKRMNRHYDTKEYKQIVDNIKAVFDNPSITTDIMVGFVGETDEEFSKTVEFVKEIGFARSHVFSYSVRAGTKAALMEDQVDQKTKEKRSKELIKVTDELKEQFLATQIGKTEQILFETKIQDDFYVGYSKNYTKVKAKSENDISGKILSVKITDADKDICTGTII